LSASGWLGQKIILRQLYSKSIRTKLGLSDLSQVFDLDDIFTLWMDI